MRKQRKMSPEQRRRATALTAKLLKFAQKGDESLVFSLREWERIMSDIEDGDFMGVRISIRILASMVKRILKDVSRNGHDLESMFHDDNSKVEE